MTRLRMPFMPWKGVSQIDTTAMPLMSAQCGWIGSKANTLGTKYTDAVVSRSSCSSCSMRGALDSGNAMWMA